MNGAGAATLVLFWSVVDGVLLRYALRVMDSSYERVDALVDSDTSPPADPIKRAELNASEEDAPYRRW